MNWKTVSKVNFGEHLMIDGYGGSADKLNDKELLLQALSELPDRVGMNKLSEPYVQWAEPNHIKDPGGWSGYVLIAESHISIHTFPGTQFVSIDVYTCKNGMPVEVIKDYFKEIFQLQDLETNFVKRGTRYPAENLV